MATSTIRIYRTVLTPARNALVDDLDAYLGTTALTYEDTTFQYQQLGLDINVKILFSQSAISNHDLGNYVVIAQDGKKWYYFIMNTEWKGTNTVNLRLSLDTINTFRNDLTFTKKTTIQRQHKDRFVTYPALSNNILSYLDDAEWNWSTGVGEIIGTARFRLPDEFIGRDFTSTISLVQGQGADVYNYEYDSDLAIVYITAYVQGESAPIPQGRIRITTTSAKVTPNQLVRKIDLLSEGILPQKYHNTEDDIKITEVFDSSWNLVYMSDTNDETAVRCLLYPDDNVIIKVHGGINALTPNSLVSGNYYYFTDGNYNIINDTNDQIIGTVFYSKGGYAPDSKSWGIIYVNNNTLSVKFYKTSVVPKAQVPYYEVVNTVTEFHNLTSIRLDSNNEVQYQRSTILTDDYDTAKSYPKYTLQQEEFVEKDLKSINSLDRTDAKLIKIIKLPYCPSAIKVEDNALVMDGPEWTYNEQSFCLELTNLNIKFNKVINLGNAYNPYDDLKITVTPSISDLRNDNNESKLYHSDFYQPKFVYDSFGFNFLLETMQNRILPTEFNMRYYVTSTINSKFAFKFEDYKCQYGLEDYNNILTISRNNEMTIYNSDYLNYIKVGYNYDKKAKEAQLAKSAASTALSVLGGAAVGALKGSAGGPGGIIAGAAIGLAGGIIGIIASQAAAENNINQKLDQYRNQTTSVAGSDDIDLLEAYSDNRAKMITYNCSDNMKKLIADLFYYCGYKCDYQDLPNITSRYWFNFIQCTPIFREEGTSPYNYYIDDIKSRYESGVTVYHHHTTWDFDQVKENWENSLIN